MSDNNTINFSDEELLKRLTPDQYSVTQQQGTEEAFSGDYYATDDDGIYACIVCDKNLFSSDTKFDSGDGWPSFWEPISEDNVDEEAEDIVGVSRMEVQCMHCGAHLGHVFKDGPQPTGLRYSINSASLNFKKGQNHIVPEQMINQNKS